jgi:dihydropteroate synthase
VAPIFLATSNTNAHLLAVASASDLRRHLGEIDVPEDEIEELTGRFLHHTVKVEGIDTRAANLMKKHLEALGGGLAMRRETHEASAPGSLVREIDVILSGSRHTLRLLASRLKGEPFGLEAVGAEIAACAANGNRVMSWGSRTLDFSRTTYVMGILNCTPDSFFPGSRSTTIEDALRTAREMTEAGVDIIDVGGESTRPGSDGVEEVEEIRRVIPVIEKLRKGSDVMISVDTRKKGVAERALDAGADIVNDIAGLRHDKELPLLIARRGVPVVLMHMRGTPKTMQQQPYYKNTMSEILRELRSSIAAAMEAGIAPDLIIVDPGIGFGKRTQDNLRIIGELATLTSLNLPILVGLSRKGFIGEILDVPVEERLIGTITANTLAIINGADIVRVHDVAEAKEMVAIIDSVRRIRA